MSEEPTTTTETIKTPETSRFDERHLELTVAVQAKAHKGRILKAFKDGRIPELPVGQADTRYPASKDRFKRAYDLLLREDPAEMPVPGEELDQTSLMALADNLSYVGIRNSIVSSHLGEVNRALVQSRNGRGKDLQAALNLEKERRALTTVVVEDNHFVRDFFDSELAAKLKSASPRVMAKILRKATLYGVSEEGSQAIAKGLSLEIATRRYLERGLGDNAIVEYGTGEQDRQGGDIVVARDSGLLYIDLKSSRPAEVSPDEEYTLSRNPKGVYKAKVWPATREAVSQDSFRLTDDHLKLALQKVLKSTS
jgi:hypothetical protein